MSIDRKQVKKYFDPFNRRWYYFLGGGILGMLIFYSVPIILLVSLGLAAFGAWKIYDYSNNRPTDKEMDQWLEEDLERLEPDSLSKRA